MGSKGLVDRWLVLCKIPLRAGHLLSISGSILDVVYMCNLVGSPSDPSVDLCTAETCL